MKALDPQATVAAAPERAVLDVRDARAFAAGHYAGSGNLPQAELASRRSELPPRGAPVLVLAEEEARATAAAATLEDLGYLDVAFLAAPLSTLPGGVAALGPPARLWQPAAFLAEVLPLVLAAAPPPPGPGLQALDLASGSGRDAVFLALNGLEVEAWDHAPEALQRARELASHQGVTLRTVRADLEWQAPPLPEARYDLVTCFRFLHRPLFPAMARALRPGGWLIYETYRDGQQRFGRPRRARFLLRPGELRGAFPGLAVVHYEEREPPEGPVTACLLARRPLEDGSR